MIDMRHQVVVCMNDAEHMPPMYSHAAFECKKCKLRVGYKDLTDLTARSFVVMTRIEAKEMGITE